MTVGKVIGNVVCTPKHPAVSGIRLVAVDNGRVIAAGWSGKVKTAATMLCICLMLLRNTQEVNLICTLVILLTTLASGAEYFINNLHILKSES